MSKQNNMRSINWRQRGWSSVGWKNSDVTVDAPADSTLHWDADIDPYAEQTGGVHTFNHAVLSPQYRRNADGSYSDVGAKPAVDVFDGEKWLRSCGAVQNLLPSGAENFVTGWFSARASVSAAGQVTSQGDAAYRVTATSELSSHRVYKNTITPFGAYTARLLVKKDTTRYCSVSIANQVESGRFSVSIDFDLKKITTSSGIVSYSFEEQSNGWFLVTLSGATIDGDTSASIFIYVHNNDNVSLFSGTVESVLVGSPQLTATSYPVPYVPPGVTQPASNATATNGSWFALPDGSPLWQALDGQADGVELVTNGGFDEGFTNWTIQLVGNQSIALEPNGARFVFDGSADAGSASQSAMLPIGEYIVEFDVSEGSTGAFKILPFGSYGEIVIFMNTWAGKRYSAKMSITASNVFRVSRVVGQTCNARIDNISIQRIQPQPLTLATRVRMGVGSADYRNGVYGIVSSAALAGMEQYYYFNGNLYSRLAATYDGTTVLVSGANVAWPRNSIIRRVTQVNTAGTQFRVGYMIEGTDTAIQWGSWTAFDGSFNPATLYRLMLGYGNAYPVWFNKITAWKKQVTDAEILEAMA